MPGAVLLRGLWAAARGDSVAVAAYQDSLGARSAVERRRLGYGPVFMAALLVLRRGRPAESVRLIGPATADGENDATNLDRVSTIGLRLVTAAAYGALGRPDSSSRTPNRPS